MAKVFVIDDSLSVCFAIERMLRARGLEVVSRRSGQEALESLEEEEPDLVMCDLVLPDIEGFQICTFLQSHPTLSSVPVIVISGIVDEEVRKQATEVGAVAVLKKPFATEEMVQQVEKFLGQTSIETDEESSVTTDSPSPEVPLTGQEPPDDSEPHEASQDDTGPQETAQDEPKAEDPTLASVLAASADASSGPETKASKAPRILLSTRPVEGGDPLLDRLEARLEPLAAIETLKFACILSPAGELRGYGPAKPTPTDLAALPQLVRAAANTATHTGHGEVGILTLETSTGVLVVKPQEEGHLLVLGLGDLSVLGKARYLLRRLATD